MLCALVAVLEQLGIEAESSYSTSLPRNFPPSRDIGDRPMVCGFHTRSIIAGQGKVALWLYFKNPFFEPWFNQCAFSVFALSVSL